MRLQLVILSVVGLAAASGCGDGVSTFKLNSKTDALVTPARKRVQETLLEDFGTPSALVAWQKFPINYGEKSDAHPEAGWELKHGRDLYMVQCLHCHGVAGDGEGTTAKFLNPRPRDYRKGVFKFTSTLTGLKPSRHDLKTTLQMGIPGTSMPSFVLLPQADLDALVEYIRWLSTRGEFEIKIDNEMVALGAVKKDIDRRVADGRKAKEGGETYEQIMKDLDKSLTEEFGEQVNTVSTDLAESWSKADMEDVIVLPKVPRTPSDAASLKRGKELYVSKKAKCSDCHGVTGRGNGPLTEDFWVVPNSSPEIKYEDPGLHDDWGFPLQPRNLTRGVYRGGRRPLDIYRRIFAGIKGTPMPAFGGTVLTDAEIWDIVNYVMSLPFEGKPSVTPAMAEGPAGDHGHPKQAAPAKADGKQAAVPPVQNANPVQHANPAQDAKVAAKQ